MISPPAQFAENPLVVLLDSDSDGSESEVCEEPSPSVNIRSKSKQTSRKTSKAKTKISLEARMENALAKPHPWKCSICADRFETTKNLRNHAKAHHKDYKHFCSQCPHFSKYHIDGHERSHEENERKYKNRGKISVDTSSSTMESRLLWIEMIIESKNLCSISRK